MTQGLGEIHFGGRGLAGAHTALSPNQHQDKGWGGSNNCPQIVIYTYTFQNS